MIVTRGVLEEDGRAVVLIGVRPKVAMVPTLITWTRYTAFTTNATIGFAFDQASTTITHRAVPCISVKSQAVIGTRDMTNSSFCVPIIDVQGRHVLEESQATFPLPASAWTIHVQQGPVGTGQWLGKDRFVGTMVGMGLGRISPFWCTVASWSIISRNRTLVGLKLHTIFVHSKCGHTSYNCAADIVIKLG